MIDATNMIRKTVPNAVAQGRENFLINNTEIRNPSMLVIKNDEDKGVYCFFRTGTVRFFGLRTTALTRRFRKTLRLAGLVVLRAFFRVFFRAAMFFLYFSDLYRFCFEVVLYSHSLR